MKNPTKIKRFVGAKFDTRRLRERIKEHPQRPSTLDISETLGVTPPTVGRDLKGFDLPLSRALAYRSLFAPDLSIDELWRQ